MPNKDKGKQAEETTDRKVPQPNQKTENFLFIKCLGSGSQGSVWEARDLRPGVGADQKLKAIKLFNKNKSGKDVYYLREIAIANFIRKQFGAKHPDMIRMPNIINYFGEGFDAKLNREYMALELASDYTLHSAMAKNLVAVGDEIFACDATWDILNGLSYLNEIGVYHRDIKPSNILIRFKHAQRAELCITDFGSSCATEPNKLVEARIGTRIYTAPEIYRAIDRANEVVPEGATKPEPLLVGVKSDVFSVGVTLIEILTGKMPFYTPCKTEQEKSEVKNKIYAGLSKASCELSNFSTQAQGTVGLLLTPDPDYRPSARAARNLGWFKQTEPRPEERRAYMRLEGRKNWLRKLQTEQDSARQRQQSSTSTNIQPPLNVVTTRPDGVTSLHRPIDNSSGNNTGPNIKPTPSPKSTPSAIPKATASTSGPPPGVTKSTAGPRKTNNAARPAPSTVDLSIASVRSTSGAATATLSAVTPSVNTGTSTKQPPVAPKKKPASNASSSGTVAAGKSGTGILNAVRTHATAIKKEKNNSTSTTGGHGTRAGTGARAGAGGESKKGTTSSHTRHTKPPNDDSGDRGHGHGKR